jgi:hypothetical protein
MYTLSRNIPSEDGYDILVAGGGPAGRCNSNDVLVPGTINARTVRRRTEREGTQ